MLLSSMAKMMEMLAPSSVHVLNPNKPSNADGLVKEVYAQIREEFFVSGPWVLHSDIPELLAACWCLTREVLLAGHADRGHKEIIAWSISQSNECPYCIGAHHAAMKSTGVHDEGLEQWARFSFSAEFTQARLPKTAYSAEFLGTLVLFHYLNRMVSVFLNEKPMPLPGVLDPVTKTMTQYMMGNAIKSNRNMQRGASLQFLPNDVSDYAWQPEWSESDQHIAKAIAGWSGTIESVAHDRLNPTLLQYLGTRIEKWQGGRKQRKDVVTKDVIAALGKTDRAAVELALLSVMAPHTVKDSDLESLIAAGWTKENTLALISWCALRAARQCATWTVARG